MKTKQDWSGARELYLFPSLAECPLCKQKLIRFYSKTHYIVSLKGKYKVISQVLRCPKSSCNLHHTGIRPEKESLLSLKGRTFAIDVIVFIGQSYFNEKLSTNEIYHILRNKYQIDISKSEVCLLANIFDALVKLVVENDMETILYLRQQGGIILSIDGIEPQKGHKVTYIFRDVISGRVLLVKSLDVSSSEEFEKLIAQVKGYGIPILAVISDNQKALVKAIEAQLPDVIHQICQYHYIRDAFKPLFKEDAILKQEITKSVRGIRQVEKSIDKADSISNKEKYVLKKLCFAIKEVLKTNGQYPYDPPGIKLYDKLMLIKNTVDKCLELGGNPLYFRKLQNILQPLSMFTKIAEKLKIGWQWLRDIATLLKGKETKIDSYEQLKQYLKKLEDKYMDIHSRKWLSNIDKVTNSFGDKIFSFLEKPYIPNPNLLPEGFKIPRTNNDMEIFIGVIKKAPRKITGRKANHQFLIAHAECAAILYSLPKNIDWNEKFSMLEMYNSKIVKNCLKQTQKNPERSERWKVKRCLNDFLKEATDIIQNLNLQE